MSIRGKSSRKLRLTSLLVSLTVLLLAQCGHAATETITYTYDSMLRLVGAKYGNGSMVEYSYDLNGNRIFMTTTTSGAATNKAPLAPSSPSPVNGAVGVSPGASLTWTGGDPDASNDETYDIYFGTSSSLDLVARQRARSYAPTSLAALTTYSWKVVARDNHNATTEGPVWSFTTGNRAPAAPTNPSPAKGSLVVNTNAYLAWDSAGDPDYGDTVSYDVYFGSSTSPSLVQSGSTSRKYVVGNLSAGTKYYWKIVAKDNHGAATQGAVWTFDTPSHDQTPLSGVTYSEDATLTRNGGPYIVSGTLTVAKGVTLTIEPGAIIKFQSGARLTVKGSLIAKGAEDNPVVFTSYRNDKYGGDTNGDSDATSPAPGDWDRIQFEDSSSGRLEYCIVEYGGSGSSGAIYINGVSPTIRNCTIRYSSSYGIYIYYGSPVIADNVFSDNAKNDLYDYSGNGGAITGNTFTHGVYITSGTYAEFSDNAIQYDNSYPVTLPPSWVGSTLAVNTFSNLNGSSYINVLGGAISQDATWTNILGYHILASISIKGADGDDWVTTLTIEPGTTLSFARYTSLDVGSNDWSSPGALVAQGSSDAPIIFTSSNTPAAAGDWYGIRFFGGYSYGQSLLDHCIVEYGGYSSYGDVYIQYAYPTITNCIIRLSSNYGVNTYYGSPTITGSAFTNNSTYDLYCNSNMWGSVSGNTFTQVAPARLPPDMVGMVVNNNTFTGDEASRYIEVIGGILNKDATWLALLPYHILGSITISGTDGSDGVTTLTIKPGAVLRFARYASLNVGGGSLDVSGGLIAQGTAASPILFTSNQSSPAPGDWYGIRFYDTASDSLCILDHCVIEYGGYNNYGDIYIQYACPIITSCIIRLSSNYGVNVYYGAPTITGSTFTDNSTYDLYCNYNMRGTISGNTFSQAAPVRLPPDMVAQTYAGNTFTNVDASTHIEVLGGTITKDATWKAGLPYVILGGITITGTDGSDSVTTLTIEPGAVLRFARSTSLNVGSTSGAPGALVADGKSLHPILFTSGESTPAPGDWYGIRFYNTSADALCLLDHCTVEYGGYSGYANVYAYEASPAIKSCLLRYSSNSGLYIRGAGASGILVDCNDFQENVYGVYTYGVDVTILNNDFLSNTTDGVYNYSSGNLVTAKNNWWGDVNGPNASGDAVYGNVDYTPWALLQSDCPDPDGAPGAILPLLLDN